MAHPKRVIKRKRERELRTVPSGTTRNRLKRLSSLGIGRKAVHEITGLDQRTLAKIKNGRTRYVRLVTKDLIFSVPLNAHSDRALIDARPTWNRIRQMITRYDMGFTQSEIARRLGDPRKPGYAELQIGRTKVTARTAMRIEKLFNDAKAS